MLIMKLHVDFFFRRCAPLWAARTKSAVTISFRRNLEGIVQRRVEHKFTAIREFLTGVPSASCIQVAMADSQNDAGVAAAEGRRIYLGTTTVQFTYTLTAANKMYRR